MGDEYGGLGVGMTTGAGVDEQILRQLNGQHQDGGEDHHDRHDRGDPEAEFWNSRRALQHIRAFAYARLCSPWAVLGVVILRVLHHIPPWVTLPPLIGGRGSLNLFAALSGPPGSGKGAAETAAADAFDLHPDPVYTAAAGSGEGIAHQYAHHEKAKIVWDRKAVLFTSAEIDGLAALQSRQGSTLMPQLRSAFLGERLGFAYADPTRRIPMEAHSYRLGLIIGVQPERAAALLDQSDGGTPQRFVWLPSTDPGLVDDPLPAPKPMVITATRRSWNTGPGDVGGFLELSVPDEVKTAIRGAHVARTRGDGHALDGHALFAREKIAQALALLDERIDMDLVDWQLAGRIMTKSDHTRDLVVARLRAKQETAENERAKRDGKRAVIVAETVASADQQRVVNRMIDYLTRHGESARSDVRRALRGPDRHLADQALDQAIEAGVIVAEEARGGGQRLRRG